jgi:ATP-binding cassette subfamily B protein
VSTIVIIVFSILIIIIKFTNHYYRQSTQDNANFTTLINETYTGNAIVKSFNLNQIFQKKFNLANKALYKSSKKAKLYSSIISPILLSAVYIGEITLCVLGTV